MKPLAQSYLMTALAGAALVLAGCAAGPTGKKAQTSAAKRVITAYQVPNLLAEAAPAVSQSLAKNLPSHTSAADRSRMDRIVNNAYAPERLRGGVVERLKRQAAADPEHKKQLAAAADTLEKPLVQRMITLENEVTKPGFKQGFKAFVSQPAGAERKQRLQIVNRLAAHMQVVSLQTGFNITLLESMIRARNAAVAKKARVSGAKIQRILTNTRDGISAKLQKQVPLMLLYVYRSVDTKTLRRYAGLQAVPAMIWTNRALAQAIINTLAAASQSIPRRYRSQT